MAVFVPNLTSKLLLKSCESILRKKSGSVVELGCGSGWITGQLLQIVNPQVRHNFWMSDISAEAVNSAKRSYMPPLSEDSFAVGDGLTPWFGRSFDVIISDIAGISEPLAKVSTWYQGIQCNTGLDGLDNMRRVLSELKHHLNQGGVFITPIISLSDTSKHETLLRAEFSNVHFENRKLWPLPEDLLIYDSLLNDLQSGGQIKLEAKYGKLLAFTEIAICSSA